MNRTKGTRQPFEPTPTPAFTLARKLTVFVGEKSHTLNQLYDCLTEHPGAIKLPEFIAELGRQLGRL